MAEPSTEQFSYEKLAVIGAAGKMGSGISLVLLEEMARNKITQKKKAEDFVLTLIDGSPAGLNGLKKYLHKQMLKWAERNIAFLRQAVAQIHTLVSNKEIIDYFIEKSMDIAHFATALEEAKNSELIFEAISEEMGGKVQVLSTLKQQSNKIPYFFTNTSSIPISTLNEQAHLDGRIIGFHFYNPPAVQKLIELIPLDGGDPQLTQLAVDLANKLKKEIIFSKDAAGFIGNGYFLREVMYACLLTEELSKKYSLMESIYLVNKATEEFLLRPMGIFQLIDYVGLDIVIKIGAIMNQYLQMPIHCTNLFQTLIKTQKCGGQYADVSQKDGFFQYSSNKITGIYSQESDQYIPLNAIQIDHLNNLLGSPPDHLTWKALSKASNKKALVQNYFTKLFDEKTLGAQLAASFLRHLQETATHLVEEKIARSAEDVDAVLIKGFYHPYGIYELRNLIKDHS